MFDCIFYGTMTLQGIDIIRLIWKSDTNNIEVYFICSILYAIISATLTKFIKSLKVYLNK